MIHNFDDYLLESLINEDLLTEKLSFDKIKEIVSSIRNKKSFLKKNEISVSLCTSDVSSSKI